MSDEETAAQGLDIGGYAGKWRKAKELAIINENGLDKACLPYWERVRQLFLELGGEYKKTAW